MNINELKDIEPRVLIIGNHPAIVQSILDFDFMSKKEQPSVIAMVSSGRNYQRFFYGRREILIPVFESISKLSEELKNEIEMFVNVSSGRRVLTSSIAVIDNLPNLK